MTWLSVLQRVCKGYVLSVRSHWQTFLGILAWNVPEVMPHQISLEEALQCDCSLATAVHVLE